MLFLLVFARRTCGAIFPRWAWRDSSVRRIAKLMVPVIIGSSAAQIGVLLDTVLATFLASGSISWLNYSQRLMEFPLGVFGVALATVALPKLSQLHAAGQSLPAPHALLASGTGGAAAAYFACLFVTGHRWRDVR